MPPGGRLFACRRPLLRGTPPTSRDVPPFHRERPGRRRADEPGHRDFFSFFAPEFSLAEVGDARIDLLMLERTRSRRRRKSSCAKEGRHGRNDPER